MMAIRAMLLGAATAALVAAAPVLAKTSPEEKLAKALQGRSAGVPVRCINARKNTETRIFDKTAVLFGSDETIYLQRPRNADQLKADYLLVLDLRSTTTLCAGEGLRMQDREEGWERGAITLTDFVPYTRSAKD